MRFSLPKLFQIVLLLTFFLSARKADCAGIPGRTAPGCGNRTAACRP